MKNKKTIYWVVAWLVVIWSWAYFTLANDDRTCYNYTSSASSCNVSYNNCSEWSNGKRTCPWTITTTYTRWSSYSCSNSSSETRSSYNVNSACSIEEFDNTPPSVTWGVE